MKVLITGGGGFLGSRIALMLRERGDNVTVFGRHEYPALTNAGIRTATGDIRDAVAVREACRGHDIVFHVAAITGIWGPRRTFHEINVGGTANILDACRANGIHYLVHTSTPSVVLGDEPLCGVDESQPYPARYRCAYAETKAEAERAVLSANTAALKTVALRPHLIWGPGDPHLIPRIVDRARRGRLVQIGDGTNLVDITYIDNAATAHMQAAEALILCDRCAGKAYFISQGQPVRLWAWLQELLAALGVPPVDRRISFRKACALGTIFEAAYGLLGKVNEPPMTRFLALQLAFDHYFSIAAAQRDFDYRPVVSTQEGLARFVRHWHGAAFAGQTSRPVAASLLNS